MNQSMNESVNQSISQSTVARGKILHSVTGLHMSDGPSTECETSTTLKIGCQAAVMSFSLTHAFASEL